MRRAGALLVVAAALLAASADSGHAGTVRVAVAANFLDVAREIGSAFETATGHDVDFSSGSTGQLYAQITQGAPFDVLLAADEARPQRAVADGFAVSGSRFTYAIGKLVLYGAAADAVAGPRTLASAAFDRIAVANPETAPYGAAAVEAMTALGVYDRLASKIVQGNSVAQAYQFVASGNAAIGFVALSQIAGHRQGSRWIVPQELYTPIRQDAVLLSRSAGNDAAREFLEFLKGDGARATIERFGYGLPDRSGG